MPANDDDHLGDNRRNPDDQREGLVFEVEHMSENVGPELWGIRHAVDMVGFRVKRRVED